MNPFDRMTINNYGERIDTLEAENRELREALERLLANLFEVNGFESDDEWVLDHWAINDEASIEAARAVLTKYRPKP